MRPARTRDHAPLHPREGEEEEHPPPPPPGTLRQGRVVLVTSQRPSVARSRRTHKGVARRIYAISPAPPRNGPPSRGFSGGSAPAMKFPRMLAAHSSRRRAPPAQRGGARAAAGRPRGVESEDHGNGGLDARWARPARAEAIWAVINDHAHVPDFVTHPPREDGDHSSTATIARAQHADVDAVVATVR